MEIVGITPSLAGELIGKLKKAGLIEAFRVSLPDFRCCFDGTLISSD